MSKHLVFNSPIARHATVANNLVKLICIDELPPCLLLFLSTFWVIVWTCIPCPVQKEAHRLNSAAGTVFVAVEVASRFTENINCNWSVNCTRPSYSHITPEARPSGSNSTGILQGQCQVTEGSFRNIVKRSQKAERARLSSVTRNNKWIIGSQTVKKWFQGLVWCMHSSKTITRHW